MVETVYRVPEVSCDHCVSAITSELAKVPGVEDVDVNITTKLVTVKHRDDADREAIVAGIEEAGYDISA